MKLVDFNIDRPTPDKIWEVYVQCLKGLEIYFDPSKNPNFDIDFEGLSQDEVDKLKREMGEELSIRSSFYLLAYIESLFRTDFILRLESNKKGYTDVLTKAYKGLYKSGSRPYSYSLTDVIFKSWKTYVKGKRNQSVMLDILNTLPQYFDFRNWMAHGRYWIPKESNYKSKYNYQQILMLQSKIEQYFGEYLKKKNFGLTALNGLR